MLLMEEDKDDGSTNGGTVEQPKPDQANSSTDTSTDASGDTPAGETKPAGEAGTAEPKAPKSSLDAVKAVMEQSRAAASADAKAADKSTDGSATAGEKATAEEQEHARVSAGEKDWLTREEYAKLPPRVKARLVNLTKSKNDAVEAAKTFEPKARTYDDLATYCKNAGLSQDDFSFGLEIMRLVRNDPAKAWESLQPVIRDLQAFVGEILPVDLQKEVDDGALSAARAKELAAARRDADRLRQTTHARSEEDDRRAAEAQYTERVTTVQNALASWEQTWKASDPDYEKKRERVWERMLSLIGNKPHELTPEKAIEIGKKARQDVEDWLKGVLPRKQETKPQPNGSTNTNTNKRPATSLEAARLALTRG